MKIKEKQEKVIESKNKEEIDYSLKSKDRPFYLDINGQRIWVSESVYQIYKREDEALKSKKRYYSRCNIIGERGIKKCNDDCKNCERYMQYGRSGSDVSLDYLYERFNYELKDNSLSVIDELIQSKQKEKIRLEIQKLNEFDRKIITLYMHNYTDSQIAKKLDKSQPYITKRKNILLKDLKAKIKKIKNI